MRLVAYLLSLAIMAWVWLALGAWAQSDPSATDAPSGRRTAVAAEGVAPPDDGAAPKDRESVAPPPTINLRQLLIDGGTIGYVIIGLSLLLVALIFEHSFTIRRSVLMPDGLAEAVHRQLVQGQLTAAQEACRQQPSLLGSLLSAGLDELELGYAAVEKSMEDAATQQAARLMRKIESLSIISTVAPMLGLMGTVWGMILAFMEFERKANPQVSELAPGVYKALVTTLFGLIVAVPAISAFAFFRNRIDELVAQTALLAEHVFADYKRARLVKRRALRQRRLSARGQRRKSAESPASSVTGTSPNPTVPPRATPVRREPSP